MLEGADGTVMFIFDKFIPLYKPFPQLDVYATLILSPVVAPALLLYLILMV